MTIEPIRVGGIIKSHTPSQEPIKNVSRWFLDETIELNFGETVGRPDEDIVLQKQYLTRFLENGWTIDAVIDSKSKGVWKDVSKEDANSITNEGYVKDSHGTSNTSSGNGYSSSVNDSFEYSSRNANSESGLERTTEDKYWSTCQKIRLRRRRMQPEKVLSDMVKSFTNSYNEGRLTDSERMNEIIAMYSAILRRTENEAGEILIQAYDPRPAIQAAIDSVFASSQSADSAANFVLSYAARGAEEEVNRNYDSLVAQKKAEMISTGMFNSTVWPSVHAGIERQRASALAKAKAEASVAASSNSASLSQAKSAALTNIIASQMQYTKLVDERRISLVELRNKVVKWMLDYVSSREEVYPELQEISMAAERLGFSVGAAGNVL